MLGISVALPQFPSYSRKFKHLANFVFWKSTFIQLFFQPEVTVFEVQKFIVSIFIFSWSDSCFLIGTFWERIRRL